MVRQEAYVHQEVTALQVLLPPSPAPLAPSAISLGSVHLRNVSAVHRGNITHCYFFPIQLFWHHLKRTRLQHTSLFVSFYCLGYNNTSPSGPCFPGYYCTGGSATPVQNEAEKGHFTLAGAFKAQPCPLGTFQMVGSYPIKMKVKIRCEKAIFKVIPLSVNPPQHRGAQSCVDCQAGRLCNQTGLSLAPLCPTGYYCPPGSSVARPCPPVSISVLLCVWENVGVSIQLLICILQPTSCVFFYCRVCWIISALNWIGSLYT